MRESIRERERERAGERKSMKEKEKTISGYKYLWRSKSIQLHHRWMANALIQLRCSLSDADVSEWANERVSVKHALQFNWNPIDNILAYYVIVFDYSHSFVEKNICHLSTHHPLSIRLNSLCLWMLCRHIHTDRWVLAVIIGFLCASCWVLLLKRARVCQAIGNHLTVGLVRR